MNPLSGKYDIGVIIGRFQVPGLDEAHRHLIDNVCEAHKQVIITVGVSSALGSKKNPMGYIPRMQMLHEAYPNAIITPVMDVGSDEVWSKNLDTMIRSLCPIGSICLYGGRDSFIKAYRGVYPTFEIGTSDGKSGSNIRENIGKEVINSYEFRAGLIYQSQNQYPKVFPTADVALVKKEDKEYLVLLGRRPNREQFRFPGGFVSPSDSNIEEAALRELHEETGGIGFDSDSIEYIGSNLQKDWRYQSPDEVIMTSLYKVDYTFGEAQTDEEFSEFQWVKVDPYNFPNIEASHKKLFLMLLRNLINYKGEISE